MENPIKKAANQTCKLQHMLAYDRSKVFKGFESKLTQALFFWSILNDIQFSSCILKCLYLELTALKTKHLRIQQKTV